MQTGTGPGRIDRLVAWAGTLSPFRTGLLAEEENPEHHPPDVTEDEDFPEFDKPDPNCLDAAGGAPSQEVWSVAPSPHWERRVGRE